MQTAFCRVALVCISISCGCQPPLEERRPLIPSCPDTSLKLKKRLPFDFAIQTRTVAELRKAVAALRSELTECRDARRGLQRELTQHVQARRVLEKRAKCVSHLLTS